MCCAPAVKSVGLANTEADDSSAIAGHEGSVIPGNAEGDRNGCATPEGCSVDAWADAPPFEHNATDGSD